ncbi:hypothetical protein J6590_090372, partial [Homalodisca vitripennis]
MIYSKFLQRRKCPLIVVSVTSVSAATATSGYESAYRRGEDNSPFQQRWRIVVAWQRRK